VTQVSPARVAAGTVAVVLVSIVLAHLYQGVSSLSGLQPWQAAASINTVLAAALLLTLPRADLRRLVSRVPLWVYLPAVVIVLGSIILSLATAYFWPPAEVSDRSVPWAFVLWIPIVEEVVFRAGFGSVLRSRLGNFCGAWLSAVLFALVHAAPTISNLTAGQLGLPLGPFLLALACEALMIKSGRILPVVLLHAACNLTVFIFSQLDSRWLKWLGLLYL